MAEFSGKVIDAYYINEEYSTIEVLFENDNVVKQYYIEVNPDDTAYQDLMAEGFTPEKLTEATVNYKKRSSAAYNYGVNTVAKALVENMVAKTTGKLSDFEKQVQDHNRTLENTSFDMVIENDTNKDALFKFKVWALELDAVKDADKSVKAKIRRCKSIIAGLKLVKEIVGNVSDSSEAENRDDASR